MDRAHGSALTKDDADWDRGRRWVMVTEEMGSRVFRPFCIASWSSFCAVATSILAPPSGHEEGGLAERTSGGHWSWNLLGILGLV